MEPPPPSPDAPPPGLLDHPPSGAPAYFLGLLGVLALGVLAVVWPRQGGGADLEAEPPQIASAPALTAGGGLGRDNNPYAQPALPTLGMTELYLTTQEPGASVWIDSQPAGETPLRIHALRAGMHAIRVEAGQATLLDTLVLVRTGALYHLHIAHHPPAAAAAPARRAARRPPPRSTELTPIAPLGAAELRAPARPGTAATAPAQRRDSTRIGW